MTKRGTHIPLSGCRSVFRGDGFISLSRISVYKVLVSSLLLFVMGGILPLRLDAYGPQAQGDSLSSLAAIPGADMTFYDLYESQRGKNRDKAMEYSEIFLSRIDSLPPHPVAVRMGNELARYYELDRFLFSKAIRWYSRSLAAYELEGDMRSKALTEYHLAKLWLKKGQYHKTLKYATGASEIFGSERDTVNLMECYKLLGVVYEICRDYDKSNEYFQSYAKAARILNDTSRLFVGLNNSAAFASSIGDTTKTIKLVEESIEMANRMGNTSILCKLYLNAMAAYTDAGNYKKAMSHRDMAFPLLKNIDQRGHYHLNSGSLKYKMGDIRGAIREYELAVEEYSKGEFNTSLQDCYSKLDQLYREIGDTSSAYRNLHALYELERSSGKEDALMELFRAQHEIQMRQAQKEMDSSKNRQTIVIIVVISITVALLLILTILMSRRAYRIKRREAEIANEEKIKELERIQSFKVDRTLADAVEKLNALASDVGGKETKEKIKEIGFDLKHLKDKDQWEEMSQFVPDLGGDFLNRLRTDFPDLTINESRICVLLNKNLSTKEISSITRQSPHSINIARTRLRNKLGLTGKEISFQEFFRKYNS